MNVLSYARGGGGSPTNSVLMPERIKLRSFVRSSVLEPPRASREANCSSQAARCPSTSGLSRKGRPCAGPEVGAGTDRGGETDVEIRLAPKWNGDESPEEKPARGILAGWGALLHWSPGGAGAALSRGAVGATTLECAAAGSGSGADCCGEALGGLTTPAGDWTPDRTGEAAPALPPATLTGVW